MPESPRSPSPQRASPRASPRAATPPRPSTPPKKKRRPYEEIKACFNGNEVRIRVPKTRVKPQTLTPSQIKLTQECTCEDNASICSESCGLYQAEDRANQLSFTVPDDICDGLTDRNKLNSEMIYHHDARHNVMCQRCNVTPKGAPKGVAAEKVLHPDKDVFLLKIGKHTDEPNRTGNIEVELVTPKLPGKKQPAIHSCKMIQCEEMDIPCCQPCGPYKACKPKRRGRKSIHIC